jgi:hypothetical protein
MKISRCSIVLAVSFLWFLFGWSSARVLAANAPSSITVTSSLNPAEVGQSVTLTATVTTASGTPTGTVQFMDGTAALGSPVTLVSGQATYATSWPATGVHHITANYSGDANFAPGDSVPPPVAVGNTPFSVAVGDFNGDGIPDLAVANNAGNNVSVLLGIGGGTFHPAVNYAVGAAPWCVAVGDFNGDGKLDLAVANHDSSNIGILLGNGDGTFQPMVSYGVLGPPSSVAVGDLLTTNSYLDLVTASPDFSVSAIEINNGEGIFAPPANSSSIISWPTSNSVAVGDFNNDGKLDVAVSGSSGIVGIALGNGDGSFTAPATFATGPFSYGVAVGDFNGDGNLDVAVANSAFTGGTTSVSVLLGNGRGTLAPAVNYAAGCAMSSVAVGDFSHDGKPDLALADTGCGAIVFFVGNGDGTFQPAVNYPVGNGPRGNMAVGNFNLYLGLAVANSADNTVSVLLGEGTGVFAQPLAQTIIPAPGANLSAAPTFPPTFLGQTSPPEDVTLNNTGTVPLNITAVSITSGDFAIASNTCTGTIAPGAGCTVGITFTPTAAGMQAGTLSFTDNAPNSPQSVILSAAAADFSFAAKTTSLTITPGEPASYLLQLTPVGGFNQAVSLSSCSGAPSHSTCTVTPTSVTMDGTDTVAVGLNVVTTGIVLVVPRGPGKFTPPRGSLPVAAWLAIIGLLGLIALAKFSPPGARARRLAPFAMLALLATLAVACHSVSTSSFTPTGTSTLTVTATSGKLSHAVQVTLVVE